MSLITLVNEDLSVAISPDGQLVSILKNGLEYMHGVGKPEGLKEDRDKRGWDRSELVMFPIVEKPNNGRVSMNGHDFSMDQHGISRAIPFTIDTITGNDSVVIRQSHDGKSVANLRHQKDPSSPERLEWPAYSIEKSIQLLPHCVSVELTV